MRIARFMIIALYATLTGCDGAAPVPDGLPSEATLELTGEGTILVNARIGDHLVLAADTPYGIQFGEIAPNRETPLLAHRSIADVYRDVTPVSQRDERVMTRLATARPLAAELAADQTSLKAASESFRVTDGIDYPDWSAFFASPHCQQSEASKAYFVKVCNANDYAWSGMPYYAPFYERSRQNGIVNSSSGRWVGPWWVARQSVPNINSMTWNVIATPASGPLSLETRIELLHSTAPGVSPNWNQLGKALVYSTIAVETGQTKTTLTPPALKGNVPVGHYGTIGFVDPTVSSAAARFSVTPRGRDKFYLASWIRYY
jgi:hypothetical protein